MSLILLALAGAAPAAAAPPVPVAAVVPRTQLPRPDAILAQARRGADCQLANRGGTAVFTYAFAWGIDAGLLDRATYQPAAIRGWDAIVGAVQPDGMLGWVQQVGDRPDSVSAKETQFYGAGTFLLAGTAMADLARKEFN